MNDGHCSQRDEFGHLAPKSVRHCSTCHSTYYPHQDGSDVLLCPKCSVETRAYWMVEVGGVFKIVPKQLRDRNAHITITEEEVR